MYRSGVTWSTKYRSGVGVFSKPRRSGVGVELNADPGWTGHYTKCRSGVTGLVNTDPGWVLFQSSADPGWVNYLSSDPG